jgi:hypothetical protein
MLTTSQQAFGVPYSVCGCVPDPDEASGTLSRLISKFRSSSKDEPAPAALVNPRPDLISTEDEDANASHPSEHNVEVGDPTAVMTQRAVSKRTAKAARRLERAKTARTHPKRDPWVQLQASQNAKRERDGHKEAFTDPMLGAAAYHPYWGITMFPPYGSVLSCLVVPDIYECWYSSICRFYGGYQYHGTASCAGAACSGAGCAGGCSADRSKCGDCGGCRG